MAETFDVVFRGGAIKGVAFIGALKKLAASKHKTRRLIGTSAGAIFATCHAAGYTPGEMEEEIKKTPDDRPVFASFVADPNTLADLSLLQQMTVPAATTLLDKGLRLLPRLKEGGNAEGVAKKVLGLLLAGAACDDGPFWNWLADRLAAKFPETPPAKMTLKKFHEMVNKDPNRPQQLSLIATDITSKETLILNERTAPHLPIIDAVRMSMGIPFLWTPVTWPAGVTYTRRPGDPRIPPAPRDGHLVVDGGVLSNFPIRYLLDPRHTEPNGCLGPNPGGYAPASAIGLFLDAERQVPNLGAIPDPFPIERILPALGYGSLLLDTLTDSWDEDAHRELIRDPQEEKRVICRIGTKGFSWLKFDYPYEADNGPQLKYLVQSGECAMTDFLAARR
jgi:NTE family protein